MTTKRKAWQEPMVWLMAGIPALTVVAGLYTLYVAYHSGPLDMAPAIVQRTGQAQVLESAEDKTATNGNFRAFLFIDKHSTPWQLSIKTVPASLASHATQVVFVHPNSAKQDIQVTLPANATSVNMPSALAFKPQQIMLRNAEKTWRLVGSYEDTPTLLLMPAQQAQ